MNAKRYFALQPSEGIIVRAAADIYAGYISARMVEPGRENEYMKKAIQEAIAIAEAVDNAIQSDNEMA